MRRFVLALFLLGSLLGSACAEHGVGSPGPQATPGVLAAPTLPPL